MNFLNLFGHRQHYFKLKLCFTPDPSRGGLNVTKIVTVGLTDRKSITSEHSLKKELVGNMITNSLKTNPKPRGVKSNFEIVEVYYLGHFMQPEGFVAFKEPIKGKSKSKSKSKSFTDKPLFLRSLSILNFLATGVLWIFAFVVGLVIWNKFGG